MRAFIPAAIFAVLMVGACAPEDPIQPTVATAEREMTAEELGRLGAEIRNAPEQTAQLLEEHGMTEVELESEIRRIAADPEESQAYRQAFEAGIATGG